MNPTGNVSPAGPLNGTHVPLPPPRPIQQRGRRSTSPFTSSAPTPPDPDAVARLARQRAERLAEIAATVPQREVADLPFDLERAAELYAAGMTLREAAAEVGTSHQTLDKHFHLAGVPVRPKGHRVEQP